MSVEVLPSQEKFNNAVLMQRSGDLEGAKELISLMPNDPNSYNSLALIYESKHDYQNAFEYYKKAIEVDNKFDKAYNNIGVLLYRQGRYKDSIFVLESCLDQVGDSIQTLCNIGAVYNRAKRYEDAQRVLQKAISLDPNAVGAYVNLGNVYNKVHKHLNALACHTKALEFDSKSAANYANIAITYKHLGRYEEAIKNFKKAIQINPNFTNAHFDLATTYLLLGDYKSGLQEYEWRFKKEEMQSLLRDYAFIFEKPKFSLDLETKDKTLLLYTEQGFGDMIQFIRFAKPIKEKFKDLKIKVHCRKELKTLFSQLPFVDEVISRGEEIGHFDYQYAVMSLPFLLDLQLEDICADAYIDAQEKMELNLHPYKYNIGLVWGGSITGESYPQKTFSPASFSPLFGHEDISLYSLQVGEQDIKVLKDLDLQEDQVIDLSDKLNDFAKTASVIKDLDLVITSDTAVAHLAGGMGKEVWILLMQKADWRWGLESSSTKWYRNARLFRQEHQGNWDNVFEDIFTALEEKYSIKIDRD